MIKTISVHDDKWKEVQDGVHMLVLRQESNEIRVLLKFEPGKGYGKHIHPEGEEVFVLSGVYTDHGIDYPEGTYLYYPPGSVHAPTSKDGCTIMVIMSKAPRSVE